MANSPIEIKVCIIGDTDVGKTSLSTRYCHGDFPTNSTPTIGASFLQRRVIVDSTELSLQIWDTAGQERFRSMAPMYYRGAKAAICVFDLTNITTFDRLNTWIRDLKNHADPNVVICIAGNKCDKAGAIMDIESFEEYARSVNGTFFLTSALTGIGIQEIFENLSKNVYEAHQANPNPMNEPDRIRLGPVEEAKKGCCYYEAHQANRWNNVSTQSLKPTITSEELATYVSEAPKLASFILDSCASTVKLVSHGSLTAFGYNVQTEEDQSITITDPRGITICSCPIQSNNTWIFPNRLLTGVPTPKTVVSTGNSVPSLQVSP
jgi:small GTP-binding protein